MGDQKIPHVLEQAIEQTQKRISDAFEGAPTFQVSMTRPADTQLPAAPGDDLVEVAARALSKHLTGSEDCWPDYVDDVIPILSAVRDKIAAAEREAIAAFVEMQDRRINPHIIAAAIRQREEGK